MINLFVVFALAALAIFIALMDWLYVRPLMDSTDDGSYDYRVEGVSSGNATSVVILLLAIVLISVSECASMNKNPDELPKEEVPQDTYVVVREDALAC